MIRLCKPAIFLLVTLSLNQAAKAEVGLVRTLEQSFAATCAKAWLIKPRDCACAWQIVEARLPPRRIALSISILRTLGQSRSSDEEFKPVCLQVLEQEGPQSFQFIDAFIEVFGAAKTACVQSLPAAAPILDD